MTDACNFIFRLSNGEMLSAHATNKWVSLLSDDRILIEDRNYIQQFINFTIESEGDKISVVDALSMKALLMVIDYQTHFFLGFELSPYQSDDSCGWRKYLEWAFQKKDADPMELNRLISMYKSNRIIKIVQGPFLSFIPGKEEIILPPYHSETEFVQFLKDMYNILETRQIITTIHYNISPFRFEVFTNEQLMFDRLQYLKFPVNDTTFFSE